MQRSVICQFPLLTDKVMEKLLSSEWRLGCCFQEFFIKAQRAPICHLAEHRAQCHASAPLGTSFEPLHPLSFMVGLGPVTRMDSG